MWVCPVCNQQSESLLCASCGFDGSCDLEHYPTLVVPAALPSSILRRKTARDQENKKLLHCAECGKDQFRFHTEERAFICVHCRHRIPIAQVFHLNAKPTADESVKLYNLGNAHYRGKGVAKNYTLAVDYFRKAADLGNPAAQHSLGYCYQFGQGVQKNLPKAVIYYRLAANQGHPAAQFNLGYCFYHGHGVSKDYPTAADYFRKAADQGNISAQVWLAGCYYYGRGVSQSYEKAAEYYRKAANQGNPYAHKCLGDCYRHGRGVPQSAPLAAKHFNKIAAG